MAKSLNMTTIQNHDWRDDFPIMRTSMNGQPLIYLDTASSAQKPQAVIDKMTQVMETNYSNIHRGLYAISQNITEEYEFVRLKIKNFLNIPDTYSIIFTRNTTEAINLVAQSFGRTFLQDGDEIILSSLEHHANIVPWQLLKNYNDLKIKPIPLLQDNTLDIEAYASLLTKKTKIIAINHISNSLGNINKINDIISLARNFNPEIKVIIDGSQAVVHSRVNLTEIDADFYAFTGHKIYGPSGVGVLIGKTDLLNQMPPYQGGGDMIETVGFDHSTYKQAPFKFEAGTPAITEVIGLGAAIDYLSGIGMDNIAAHEQTLLKYATQQIKEIDGITIYGDISEKAAIISFTAEWAHISDIAMILDQCGVAVRSGHHCCMPLMKILGIEGTVRASFGLYNTHNDIDIFIKSLKKAKKLLA